MKTILTTVAIVLGMGMAAQNVPQQEQKTIELTYDQAVTQVSKMVKPLDRKRKIYIHDDHVVIVTSTVYTREQYESLRALSADNRARRRGN